MEKESLIIHALGLWCQKKRLQKSATAVQELKLINNSSVRSKAS
jgi:hypothetical protein